MTTFTKTLSLIAAIFALTAQAQQTATPSFGTDKNFDPNNQLKVVIQSCYFDEAMTEKVSIKTMLDRKYGKDEILKAIENGYETVGKKCVHVTSIKPDAMDDTDFINDTLEFTQKITKTEIGVLTMDVNRSQIAETLKKIVNDNWDPK
jgi:hypothetical protein